MDIKERFEFCFKLTTSALENIELINKTEASKRILEFARDYYSDAQFFAKKEDYPTALEAIAYAHGLVDAGVIAGFFRIPGYHLEGVK